MSAPIPTGPSRRQFLAWSGAAGAAVLLDPRLRPHIAAHARRPADGIVDAMRAAAATDPIDVVPLRGGVSAVLGSGGNVTALRGREGMLLVDSGIVGSRVMEALARGGRVAVRQVINTHWHFDHTDANAWWQERGAAIIGHANADRRMSTSTRVDDWNHTFPASPAAARPATLVRDTHRLAFGGEEITLTPFAPAHTDGDLAVHLTGSDVLVTGDVWWNDSYPFIDHSTGGSIGGTIRAAEATLRLAGPKTIIVPGHGAPGTRADLARYRDMLVGIRERVARLKQQGSTADDVVAARPTAAFDAAWGHGVIPPDFFARIVYQSA